MGAQTLYTYTLTWLFNPFFISLFSELLWYIAFRKGTRSSSKLSARGSVEAAALKHMRSVAPKKYHDLLTPSYPYGCKRRIFDSEWLQSMHDPRFTLVNGRISAIDSRNIKIVAESAYEDTATNDVESSRIHDVPADVIVLGTGFHATRFLQPLKVYGRGGQSIHDVWDSRGGPQAYMGISLDKFPNFFMLLGPNTFVGHTSVIIAIENAIGYVLKMIRPILRGKWSMIEPSPQATLKWVQEIDKDMKNTVFADCSSWYNADSSDRNSTMYPRSQFDYYYRCQFPIYGDWIRS